MMAIAFNCGHKHGQRRSLYSSGWKTVPHRYKLTAKKEYFKASTKLGKRLYIILWDFLIQEVSLRDNFTREGKSD